MAQDKNEIAYKRKDAHLDLAKSDLAKAQITHPFDKVSLQHHALPDMAMDEIDVTKRFLSKRLDVPFFIGAMTGGTDRADAINACLAEVAQETNIALALGSQRASLANNRDVSYLRKLAPNAVLIGNLGITQLAQEGGFDMAMRAIDSIEANAMAIHLNPLQEAAQPEGDHDWRGVTDALAHFIKQSPVPVIVKEVGAGISASLAAYLGAMGAAYVDIAGLGGTNWTRIEAARHQSPQQNAILAPFLDWGIDTKTAISDASALASGTRLIASGGIRHGLDVAKALALGADMVCAAGPILKSLESADGTLSQDALMDEITIWTEQLRLACFLTNSAKIGDLKGKLHDSLK